MSGPINNVSYVTIECSTFLQVSQLACFNTDNVNIAASANGGTAVANTEDTGYQIGHTANDAIDGVLLARPYYASPSGFHSSTNNSTQILTITFSPNVNRNIQRVEYYGRSDSNLERIEMTIIKLWSSATNPPTLLQTINLQPNILVQLFTFVVAPTTAINIDMGAITLAPIQTTMAPTTMAPSTMAPSTMAPSTMAPSTMAPTTMAPSTMAPSTMAPSTMAPTTMALIMSDQTTMAPPTIEQTTSSTIITLPTAINAEAPSALGAVIAPPVDTTSALTANSSASASISTGAGIGIGVGVLVAIIIVVFFYRRKYKK